MHVLCFYVVIVILYVLLCCHVRRNKDTHKSQGSVAKHLSWDGLLHCKFIIQFAGERNFLNRRTFGKVAGKMVVCVIHPIRLTLLSSKMQNSPDKQNN